MCRLLECEVARGRRIPMPDAEQQIDISRPRSNSVQFHQGGARIVKFHSVDRVQINAAPRDGGGNRPDRLDFGGRKAKTLQLINACPPKCFVKWLKSRKKAATDSRSAGKRKLLAAYGRTYTGETGFTPQTESSRRMRDRSETRVCEKKLCEPSL